MHNPDTTPPLVYLPQYIRDLREKIKNLEWENPESPAVSMLKTELEHALDEHKQGKTHIPTF